ncbi:MAG TPA: hypothetical protein PLA50_10705, partial [Bacteroidia bacterium]|nr:hypothetical protein [Bacteroidia bacterium]
MSESQKMLASVSGTVVAHVLLLLLAMLLVRANPGVSAGRNLAVVPRPREVTVSIGDLMERIERQ